MVAAIVRPCKKKAFIRWSEPFCMAVCFGGSTAKISRSANLDVVAILGAFREMRNGG